MQRSGSLHQLWEVVQNRGVEFHPVSSRVSSSYPVPLRADTWVRPYEDIPTRCMNGFFDISVEYAVFCLKSGTEMGKRVGLFLLTYTACRRGGPVCPPSGNILRFAPMFGEFAMPASRDAKRNMFVVTAYSVCPNVWNQQGRCSFSVFRSASASTAEAPLTPR